LLPVWADVLIVAAIPAILLAILKFWGREELDNGITHEQEDGKRDGDDDQDLLVSA